MEEKGLLFQRRWSGNPVLKVRHSRSHLKKRIVCVSRTKKLTAEGTTFRVRSGEDWLSSHCGQCQWERSHSAGPSVRAKGRVLK